MRRAKIYKGRAYGCDMSAAERKGMNMEIQRQLAEYDKKHWRELDSLILYVLYTEFGFREKRLKRFYEIFAKAIKGLVNRYDMEDEDQVWLCTKKLKDFGIDISEWEAEKKFEED